MSIIDKVFVGFAAFGGSLFLLRMILFAIGGFSADADTDGDIGDVDGDFDGHLDVDGDVHGDLHGEVHGDFDASGHGDGAEALADSSAIFRMISIQSVTAFFMMFGLVGLTLRKEASMNEALSIIGALAAGVASFWIIAKLLILMRRLQSSGNVRLANAIGLQGSVYLTIPAGGVGKVQAVVQQRLKHVDAVARDGEPIPTGERVTIVGMGPDNTLVVERVRE